jgi:AcrR family transcriptional regulator
VTEGRRPRRDEVRARVLEAAAEVVAERGLAGASLDQVAAAAGFTKGAVYSNFASKDELFLALLGDHSARRIEAVEGALARARDVPEALAAVAAELGRPDAGSQLLLVEFWQRAVRDPAVREAFVRSRRALRAQVAEAAGAFLTAHPSRTADGRPWDPQELAVVLVALANGLALEGLPDPAAVPDGLVDKVLRQLVL